MQQNLTKQQNFKLELLEIKKVGWSKMVLKGSWGMVHPGS